MSVKQDNQHKMSCMIFGDQQKIEYAIGSKFFFTNTMKNVYPS